MLLYWYEYEYEYQYGTYCRLLTGASTGTRTGTRTFVSSCFVLFLRWGTKIIGRKLKLRDFIDYWHRHHRSVLVRYEYEYVLVCTAQQFYGEQGKDVSSSSLDWKYKYSYSYQYWCMMYVLVLVLSLTSAQQASVCPSSPSLLFLEQGGVFIYFLSFLRRSTSTSTSTSSTRTTSRLS